VPGPPGVPGAAGVPGAPGVPGNTAPGTMSARMLVTVDLGRAGAVGVDRLVWVPRTLVSETRE